MFGQDFSIFGKVHILTQRESTKQNTSNKNKFAPAKSKIFNINILPYSPALVHTQRLHCLDIVEPVEGRMLRHNMGNHRTRVPHVDLHRTMSSLSRVVAHRMCVQVTTCPALSGWPVARKDVLGSMSKVRPCEILADMPFLVVVVVAGCGRCTMT
jgi:hypothetical protein